MQKKMDEIYRLEDEPVRSANFGATKSANLKTVFACCYFWWDFRLTVGAVMACLVVLWVVMYAPQTLAPRNHHFQSGPCV
jgi:hypothetical protein